jgi:hypothetical protein
MAGFACTQGKGFRITFANGWAASVQFGRGNYSDNYDTGEWGQPAAPSSTAEIAGIHSDGTWYSFVDRRPDVGPDAKTHVEGWQTPEQVLAFLNILAALPDNPASGAEEEHF